MNTVEPQQRPDIGLREIFYLFWRRKFLILSCIALCLIGGGILLTQLKPLYQARALVKIENVVGQAPSTGIIFGEVQVLKSRPLAARVTQTLDLINHPDFGILSDDDKATKIVTMIGQNLMVKSLGRSHVIEVVYKNNDPQLAAKISNELVAQYISGQIGAKFSDNQQNADWLDKRLKDLAVRVRKSAQAVEQYRSDNGLVDGYKADTTSQQISEINSQLVLSKTQTAEAKAQFSQVASVLEGKQSFDSLPAAMKSDFIQRLKQEETALLRKLSELRTRYGEKHPSIIDVQAELSGQRAKIRQEVKKIAQSLETEFVIAEARQQSLQESLDELGALRGGENQSTIQLEELEREAQANKELYETFLNEFKKADQQKDNQRPDARIVARADVPIKAIWPNRFLILFLAGLGGTMIGVIATLVIESVDDGYRTSRDLEEIFKIPAITMIPLIKPNKKSPQINIADYILNEPYSAVAEAIRSLRVSLSLRHNTDIKVISVTSSVPGEGKTTLSVWLARAMANAGKKTLLIDCDLRRPMVHQFFDEKNDVTLVDILLGKKSAEELISIDQKTGLHRIFARPMAKGEADILSAGGMEQLIGHLRDVYDVIILDTPPSLAVSDSRILSKLADKVLYVVQWQKTPRETVNTAVRHIMRDDIDVAGFVISQVNTEKHAQYHYGDMGSYYMRYHDYFSK